MTFPSAVKKSSPATKTGLGSKTLSPRSPGSPLNAPTKLITGSSVKVSSTSNAPEKINVGTSVQKSSNPPKSPAAKSVTKSVINVKSETEKTVASTTIKGVTKSVIKPPPLKLNIKPADDKVLLSPATPKSVTKTPTALSMKSPMTAKSSLATKSPVSTGAIKLSSSMAKSSQATTVSSTETKCPQVLTASKSSTTSPTVRSAVSSPVTKSPQISTSSKSILSSPVAKSSTSAKTSTVPKSPQMSVSSTTSTVKSGASKTSIKVGTSLKSASSKDQATVVKPTTPIKKTAVLSSKNVINAVPANKSAMTRSPSTASSIKSISLKTPTSPIKSLTKEPTPVKKTLVKSTAISKSDPTSPKVMVKKESSAVSLLSVKSSSTIKSTILSTSNTTTSKSKINHSLNSKNLAPKSPIAKSPSITVTKNPLLSPTVKKNPSPPTMKTPQSPAKITKTSLVSTVKINTPSSPTVKTRTSSVTTMKSPSSPTVKKVLPTKLILSPGLSKSKSLSSSRLSSVSTESLTSGTSLKSPMSPKPTKIITKSSSKAIIKIEEPKIKSIRGGQSIKKTIDIPGITELPSIPVSNKKENPGIQCELENVLKEEIESSIPHIENLDSLYLELESHKTVADIDDGLKIMNNLVTEDICNIKNTNTGSEIPNSCINEDKCNIMNTDSSFELNNDFDIEDTSNTTNTQNVDQSSDIKEHNLETIEEDSTEPSPITSSGEQKPDVDLCQSLDFVVVNKDECVPQLNSISHSTSNSVITFDDNHFETVYDNVMEEQLDETQSCILDTDEHFEPMNDKLVLGDVPFETDSSQDDVSDNEQTIQKETINIDNIEVVQNNYADDVFLFNNFDGTDYSNNNTADSTDNFIHQFMPKSVKISEGSSSISTDDGSSLSRKSYSRAVSGSFKDDEYYFDYDIDLVDDSLDDGDDDSGKSVFVEKTEKEFPELQPKDLSGKRRRNRKQKKRNHSTRTESQSDSNTFIPEINYNHEDFNGNEFCQYISMMKDCSFYPNGLFSSDSVKLSSSSSMSWLDISVRTTDDDLTPSTECLSTYEIFKASNLNKDFLASIIGSTVTNTTNETWFWKSIEGRNQSNIKANITLSLKPRPKHLTTPRFMILLALISEAKGYNIKPSLSEHFVTTDCMSRFNEKISRLMVEGFWFIGRLIQESLSEDNEVNCGNPFNFVDGDLGFWWAGINMLDWQEYMKGCDNHQELPSCNQFVIDNLDGYSFNSSKAKLSMNAEVPEDFLSDLDVENFIHTVRNIKYYNGKEKFVDSQENLELLNETCDSDVVEWENNSGEKQH